jgi:hypothetical protein
VDEEDALRKLLTSDEEEEEGENEEKKNNEEGNKTSDQDEQSPNEETSVPASASKRKRKRESSGKPNSDAVKTEGKLEFHRYQLAYRRDVTNVRFSRYVFGIQRREFRFVGSRQTSETRYVFRCCSGLYFVSIFMNLKKATRS